MAAVQQSEEIRAGEIRHWDCIDPKVLKLKTNKKKSRVKFQLFSQPQAKSDWKKRFLRDANPQ